MDSIVRRSPGEWYMEILFKTKSLALIVGCAILLMTGACVERAEEVGKAKQEETAVTARPTTQISELIANPMSYDGRKVVISGKVSAGLAFEFVDEQPYLLDDGTGQVWVITHDIMPPEGSKVTVTGKVQVPYQIKGRRYEVAVLETERQ